jgi:hypothetical protein
LFKHEYVIVFQKPSSPVDVRGELLKVKRMPPWGRVQGDAWDRASRFIYGTTSLNALRRETKRVAAEQGLPVNDFGRYVIRRWYNFHTHQAALDIVLAHPNTQPEPDPFHHTVDFYLDEGAPRPLGFDLKLTTLPRGFEHDAAYAQVHPEELARWLYVNQSTQGRFHAANRLFVVLHDAVDPKHTWKLRRDFERLEQAIGDFLDRPRLTQIAFEDREGTQHQPTAGVIFCVRTPI